jgi:hypothetical protein
MTCVDDFWIGDKDGSWKVPMQLIFTQLGIVDMFDIICIS